MSVTQEAAMNAKAEFENPKIYFDRIIPDALRSRSVTAEKVMIEKAMKHPDEQVRISLMCCKSIPQMV
jgi:hypothetical protein